MNDMKYLIRFFMTLPVFFVFGLTGLARLWRFGGRFTIHGKDYEEISRAGASLLRDLHDLQNGPGLERDRAEWEEVMKQVQEFLEQHEPPAPNDPIKQPPKPCPPHDYQPEQDPRWPVPVVRCTKCGDEL